MRRISVLSLAGLFLAVAFCWGHSSARAEDGKALYADKCVSCHGEKGDGKGAMAICYNPPPTSFLDPKFWQGDVNKKITDAAENGKGQMPAVPGLKPQDIKAIIDYMSHTFK